jgi:hypothetical protein
MAAAAEAGASGCVMVEFISRSATVSAVGSVRCSALRSTIAATVPRATAPDHSACVPSAQMTRSGASGWRRSRLVACARASVRVVASMISDQGVVVGGSICSADSMGRVR